MLRFAANSKVPDIRQNKMNCQIATILAHILCLHVSKTLSTKLTDVTEDLFIGAGKNHKVISAFGDFNADKLVDIFLINDKGQTVDVLIARQDKSFVLEGHIKPDDERGNITSDDVIVGVIPADFDGNAEMDLLVLTKHKSLTSLVKLTVFWGDYDKVFKQQKLDQPVTLPWMLKDEPILFDYNADMYPDLLGELENGTRIVIMDINNRSFNAVPFPHSGKSSPLRYPQSSAYLDLNGDFYPELLLTTEQGYEIWESHESRWYFKELVNFPADVPKTSNIKQSSFADTDRDGLMDFIVPVCVDDDCQHSQIYIYSQGNWSLAMDEIIIGESTWGFVPPEDKQIAEYPITLRMGDYNMDGFPDIITTARSKDKNGHWLQLALLLTNEECEEDNRKCGGKRRWFSPDMPTPLVNLHNVSNAAFFDIYENGILDVLVVAQTSGQQSNTPYPMIRAYKQTSTTDACFIKVTVTSGLCYKDCQNGWDPYGVNQPGPSVVYESTGVDGKYQTSCASQLTQSTHFALQSPYALFGLGMTPNFVDKVIVGIANNKNQTRKREWTQIIPNAQLIVIPYPYSKPNNWIMKLFVTPSRLVLITGAVLIGTCGFLAGIIGILHWRERREDIIEKRQESHKFHFDAM